MIAKNDSQPNSQDKLIDAIAALRGDLAIHYIQCIIKNEEYFNNINGTLTINLTYSDINNRTIYSIANRDQEWGFFLAHFKGAPPFLAAVIDHTRTNVIINLENILIVLQNAMEQLDTLIADEPKNTVNWTKFKDIAARCREFPLFSEEDITPN